MEKFKTFVPKRQQNNAQDDAPQPPAKRPRGRPRKQPAPLTSENTPLRHRQRKPGTGMTHPPPQKNAFKPGPKSSAHSQRLPAQNGPLPSPPVTPQSSPPVSTSSQHRDEQADDKDIDILASLRESFSTGRDSQVSDTELAKLIYDRRYGLRDLRGEDTIDEEMYLKVRSAYL